MRDQVYSLHHHFRIAELYHLSFILHKADNILLFNDICCVGFLALLLWIFKSKINTKNKRNELVT